MSAVEDAIVAEMSGLEDSIARYEYLVGLGRDLAVASDEIRTEEHAVPGCQSRVWIRGEVVGGRLRLEADSDAGITRGIIALLVRVLDGRMVEEIRASELSFLDRTGLRQHLSPSRANGLAAMVQAVRKLAEAEG
jgi:cysteine desulfuration protein SufE